jgi:multiple sugar transport system ATP-binding protein
VAEIVLDHVTKRFPDGTVPVNDANLDIGDGEFMILVGPSGSGKSTCLNMIAGLEDITEGELRIGGRVVNQLAPKDRDIAMVFQSYALYPHMNVRENMAFGLKLARVDRAEIDRKVHQAAELLELTELLDRKPANLSGGQRQRVAMGRAIVRSPQAFLMDEPLSNLDAKLRVQMRTTVARLQNQLGTTTVYVTHDQTEAMTLGDRVAVMRAGVIQQVDTPEELYQRPRNLFVAGFIGSPAMNFLPGTLEDGRLRTALGDVELPGEVSAKVRQAGAGRELIVGIRPEHFEDAALMDATGARASPSRRPWTCWSRWGPTSTPTSASRAPEPPPRSWRSWPPTPAPATPPAAATRSSPASTRPAGPARASSSSCGSTRPGCTCSTPRTAPTSPCEAGPASGQRESRKVSTARTRR